MKVVKTIITVFVAVISMFICLISAVILFSETDYLKYEAMGNTNPVIAFAEIEYLGDEYNGESEDGFSYYCLYMTIENHSNYNYDASSVFLHYDSSAYKENDQRYYSVLPIKDETFGYDETNCIPAGKEATCSKILCIEDGCNGFLVTYHNYRTDNEQIIEIDL